MRNANINSLGILTGGFTTLIVLPICFKLGFNIWICFLSSIIASLLVLGGLSRFIAWAKKNET